jgi:hypothetical protein
MSPRDTICNKVGDASSACGHMTNILCYAQPDMLGKIDGVDFIWNEI